MPTAKVQTPTVLTSPKTPLISIVNREHWLQSCGEVIAPHIEHISGRQLPSFFISVSMPTRKGLSNTKRTIGQCIPLMKENKKSHLFIHPMLMTLEEVAGTVAHEQIHIFESGHGKAFGAIARPLGLEGKLTATTAGEAFFAQLDSRNRTLRDRLLKLGPYPHEALDLRNRKAQPTLLLKAECTNKNCVMIFRVTAKWIETPGLPKCNCGGQFKLAPTRKKKK